MSPLGVFSTNWEKTHYSITEAEHLDPANGTCSVWQLFKNHLSTLTDFEKRPESEEYLHDYNQHEN